ncbi:MAG: sugar phosphate isomerase/epimerase [Proteobacteria bacterium]|nr:sugar phosphate isomerase/epimerase [Pseudomonadota bacterium]
MRHIIEATQVNIPLTMLADVYLDFFVRLGLNPEIGLDCTALERFSLPDVRDIADRLHQNGLSITLHAPFMDLSPGSPDPAIRALTRQRFEQMLKFIPFFKPKTVVCHTAYDGKRYSNLRDPWIENSLELWSWLGTRISAEGGRLMLENVYEDGPEDIRILFENLENQHVGFCLDTGHQAAFSKCSLKTWIDSLGSYLGQIHLHDNCGQQDDHLALGLGTIDFKVFFDYLVTRIKTPPVITLEPHREKDFWPSIHYLEKIWPW